MRLARDIRPDFYERRYVRQFGCRTSIGSVALVFAVGCNILQPLDDKPGPAKVSNLVAVGKADCQNFLIDDAENEDVTILPEGQRGGAWYVYKDKLGSTIVPDPYEHATGGAHGSRGAVHVHGTTAARGITYAGVGLKFSENQAPYDISAASGVCFMAKGSGSSRVTLPDVNTVPEGGVCKNCYNSFGSNFKLTPDWKEYCFKFSKLTQSPSWGDRMSTFAANATFGIQWRMLGAGKDFDLWLDDVRLLCDAT